MATSEREQRRALVPENGTRVFPVPLFVVTCWCGWERHHATVENASADGTRHSRWHHGGDGV